MKRFAFALCATLTVAGFVVAETFNATIQKVDGSKITIVKGGGGGGKGGGGKKGGGGGAPEELTLASGAVVGKGVLADAADFKSWKLEKKFDDGVKNEAFKDASADTGVFVRITTADEDKGAVKKGQVTEILTITKGGGGKGGAKGGKKGKGG